MFKRYHLRAMLCMVLALVMVFDLVMIPPAEAVDTKSVVIGAAAGVAAGVGLTLAAPAIGSALAAVGGVAATVVGGVASVVGGVIGVGAAVLGAVGTAISAVAGFVAGIITSPLFIPALVVVGAAVAGYYLYKKYKEKKAAEDGSDDVMKGDDLVYVSPSDYEMTTTIPESDDPVDVSNEIISIGGDTVTKRVEDKVVKSESAKAVEEVEGDVATTNSKSLKDAQERYLKAYSTYTNLVTNGGNVDSATIQKALREYQQAYNEYQNMKAASNGN